MKISRRALRHFVLALSAVALVACTPAAKSDDAESAKIRAKLQAIPLTEKVNLTDDEWRKILTPAQFHVMREAGTERPFFNEYARNHEEGTFVCGACGYPLFASKTKFESGTGWPSFFQPIAADHVKVATDSSLGMSRDEVTCARCGSHLGHVFDDGPEPTHQRYCMNSAALKLEKK